MGQARSILERSVTRPAAVPRRGGLGLGGRILRGRRDHVQELLGMPTPFSATRLLAELPRLRRYARILIDDPERADRLVEETLARARQMQNESSMEPTRSTQLLALLRAVNADSDSTGRIVPPHAA